MPNRKIKLLIVEDDVWVRTSLVLFASAHSHMVRKAEDGFSALWEIREEIPDVLLSDLNMPGMSGLELLSIVRRRYPQIYVIAMSGSFSGNAVPFGVAADAFYQKGSGCEALMKLLQMPLKAKRCLVEEPYDDRPVWATRHGCDEQGRACVQIACPECLAVFAERIHVPARLVHETRCIQCRSLIHYAMVQTPTGWFSKAMKVYPLHQTFETANG